MNTKDEIHLGEVSINPSFCKTIYDIGYIGEGEYKKYIDGKKTIQYKSWSRMLQRCYSDKYHIEKPTYKDCTVCEEWLNFQVFAKWFDEHYYNCNDEEMQLDKDILNKGNKIYSPETCVFVPKRINILFTKSNNIRGEYPIGVSYEIKRNKFKAYCNITTHLKKMKKSLGYFNTPEDAFYKGYKPFKETCIKEVADEYKSKIPFKLYEAMYKYIVEIDD